MAYKPINSIDGSADLSSTSQFDIIIVAWVKDSKVELINSEIQISDDESIN